MTNKELREAVGTVISESYGVSATEKLVDDVLSLVAEALPKKKCCGLGELEGTTGDQYCDGHIDGFNEAIREVQKLLKGE